tara:strand:+ start:646 stop:831 length:186 start_codon:yes stop_codon:yes gene_type:complete
LNLDTSTIVKIIAALTALLTAISGLFISLRSGNDDPPYSYTVIHLDSQQAYEKFLNSHPVK